MVKDGSWAYPLLSQLSLLEAWLGAGDGEELALVPPFF